MHLDGHFGLVVFVMLGFGALGGLVNYCLPTADDKPTTLRRSVVVGIGASFLVPLFLNMIWGVFLTGSRRDGLKLLVFAGFCLVEVISARQFITSLTKKVIKLEKKMTATEQQVIAVDKK